MHAHNMRTRPSASAFTCNKGHLPLDIVRLVQRARCHRHFLLLATDSLATRRLVTSRGQGEGAHSRPGCRCTPGSAVQRAVLTRHDCWAA